MYRSVPRLGRIVDRRNDDPEHADVKRLLRVRLERVGHPDDRRRAYVRARLHHLPDIGESHQAVLHFEPGEVVVRRLPAVGLDIQIPHHVAEDLLSLQQSLLGPVVQLLVRVLHEGLDHPPPRP